MHKPLLSIVIPAHNRPDMLRLCLASVLRHAPPSTEIIVVDDASIQGIVTSTAQAFPGVIIEPLSARAGFCAAVNAGIRRATAPIVELLNDDTEVTPDWASAALTPFTDPTIASVAPLVILGPPDQPEPLRVDSAGDRYFIGGIAGKRGHGEVLRPEHLHPGFVFGSSASSAFYRREALLAIGGFPEDLGAYFDDVDVSFRLHQAGFRIFYQPASRVYHRVSSSYGRSSSALLTQQARNEELVFWRNLPLRTLLTALPLHLAVLCAKALRRYREQTLTPFLQGRLQALSHLPAVFRHRRQLASADVNDWGVEKRFWG